MASKPCGYLLVLNLRRLVTYYRYFTRGWLYEKSGFNSKRLNFILGFNSHRTCLESLRKPLSGGSLFTFRTTDHRCQIRFRAYYGDE